MKIIHGQHDPNERIPHTIDENVTLPMGRWSTAQLLAQSIRASIYNKFYVGDITEVECADVLRYLHATIINNVPEGDEDV